MSALRESLNTAKEYLVLEEVQLAIGEFAIFGTGISLNLVEIVSNRFGVLSFLANCMMGGCAFDAGVDHWAKAEEKIFQNSGKVTHY